MTPVAVSGLRRIGHNFSRGYLARRAEYEVAALNDLGDPKTMAHLLAFDSLLGPFGEEVEADGEAIVVGGRRLRALSIPEPEVFPGTNWASTSWLSRADGSNGARRPRWRRCSRKRSGSSARS